MGIATGRPIGFTTTPLIPANESSFWTQNSGEMNSRNYASDSVALACLVAGKQAQQAEEYETVMSLDGGKERTGGSPGREKVSDVKSPVPAIEDAEDDLSLKDLPEKLRIALEKDVPSELDIKDAFHEFRTNPDLSSVLKAELLMSDFVRRHPSRYLRSALQEATLSSTLSKECTLAIMKFGTVYMVEYDDVDPLLVQSAALIEGAYTKPIMSHLIGNESDETISVIIRESDYDKTELVDCLLKSEAYRMDHGHNYRPLGTEVWDAALSALPTTSWLTRWRVQSSRRNRIAGMRHPSWTAFRRNSLSLIRHENLTKEGAVHPLRNDQPSADECERAAAEIANLPTPIIVELLKEVVRFHPSSYLRNAVVDRIASSQFASEVYEAAAIIDSTWAYKAFEYLVSGMHWTQAKNVLCTADTGYRQDLVWVLYEAHRKNNFIPKDVAKMALEALPPQAIIWKHRMKKMI